MSFRVDQFAVDLDVEDPAAALDQPGLFSESFFKFGRQTGGLGKVTSLAAVFYRDLHEHFLFLDAWLFERRLEGGIVDGRLRIVKCKLKMEELWPANSAEIRS